MLMRKHAPALLILAVLLGFCWTSWPDDQKADKDLWTPLSEAPIALKGNEIGDLLRKWHSNGTAAGNGGDFYDNRDGGHSLLDMRPYPQLQKIEYSQEQIKARQNWGMQTRLLPYSVFGNSSTSAPPEQGGSNVRSYYTDRAGISFLFTQYVSNNLYIFPEHMDHDPGHNGVGGYGDLFPTNTPYLITSQGSSGSDQPFMRAMPYVLAAFRPEVKKRLAESGFLMPVVQMILRITSRNIKGVGEYLTGKTHPTVFEGNNVDALAMVEMAHDMQLSNIPPIALIKAVQEDAPVNGVDYFDPGLTEKLADTPMVIARIVRGSSGLRKMVVSAEESKDLNNRPLKFYWAVLRGDSRIKIDYRNDAHSVAEITIPYCNRRPIAEGSKLESNRVDIGVFVHNGAYYSPPSFITFYTLDNEARTYREDGRPMEIAYGSGSAAIGVVDWKSFFEFLISPSDSWQRQLLRRQFQPEEMAGLSKASEEYQKAHAMLSSAKELESVVLAAQKKAEEEVKAIQLKASKQEDIGTSEALQTSLKKKEKCASDVAAARKLIEISQSSERKALEQKIPTIAVSELVPRKLEALVQNPSFWSVDANNLRAALDSANEATKKEFSQAREQLISLGIAENQDGILLRLKPLSKDEERLTYFEKEMVQRVSSILLSRILFPGIVESSWRRNYVDPRIVSEKEWRDVYLYSPDGTFIGLKRYQAGGIAEFNAEGFLVIDKDSRGRCICARIVQYEAESQKTSPRIRWNPTDRIQEYLYDGPNDWKGHVQ
jgi:hypothetical protein